MTTCQTAANEFLRQFWSATYPPPVDSILSIATPTQRAAKAAKMIGYLAKTSEKVEALVRMAQQHGVDGSRVEQVRVFNRSLSAGLFMNECLPRP
jgi:transcription initiation factor TFIIH subunit 1